MKQTPRYLLVLLACCGMIAVSVGLCTNAYGVFYTPLCTALGESRAAVTVHSTICGVITGLLSSAAVQLSKKIPLRWMTSTGVLLTALSFWMMASANSLLLLNLCGVVRGIGNGLFYMPIVTVVLGNWFHKNQGAIMGGVMSFSGIAGAILSPVLSALLTRFGLAAACRFSAVFVLAAALPLCLIALTASPEEAGLVPLGGEVEKAAAISRKVNPYRWRHPVFFLLVAAIFLSVFITSLTSHLSGYTENIGLGAQTGAAMMSAVMVGNLVSKFCSGVLCDKIGVYKAFGLMLAISLAGLLLMNFAVLPVLLVASVLFGTVYAASSVGVPMLVRQVYGNKQYGDAYTAAWPVCAFTPYLSLMVMGGMYDAAQSYRPVLWMCFVMCAAALMSWLTVGKLAERCNTLQDT